MYNAEDLNNILKKFLLLVTTEYPVRDCYLFGSYAKGNYREYSDIDIAIISDNFTGNRFWDREKLAKYAVKTSYDIEVHPFKTQDFTEDNPLVKEILETGVKVNIAN